MENHIRLGNVIRTQWQKAHLTESDYANLYLGSGRFAVVSMALD